MDFIEKVESDVKIESIIDEARLPSDELKHSVAIRNRQ